MNKRYYWLKLQKDFFKSKAMKKLRKIAGGETYTIIYLKLKLLSLENDGYLYFEKIEDCFADELSLELDEEIENVKVTLLFLVKVGLIVEIDEETIQLPEVIKNTGSETQSTIRSQNSRTKALQCNTDATKCNTEKELELELELEKSNKKKKITADKSAEIEKSFNTFWKNYGKCKDKKGCLVFWKKKMTDEKRDLAIFKAKEQSEVIEAQFRKDPIRWLKKEGWDDSIIKQKTNNYGKKILPTITEQWEGKGLTDKYDWELEEGYEEATKEDLGIADMPY